MRDVVIFGAGASHGSRELVHPWETIYTNGSSDILRKNIMNCIYGRMNPVQKLFDKG
jgi:hypothetical protein